MLHTAEESAHLVDNSLCLQYEWPRHTIHFVNIKV